MAVIRMKPINHFDGVYHDYIRMEGDSIVRTRSQPGRKAAMEAVKQFRDDRALEKQPDTSMGRWTLSVPWADYWNLAAANPDLNSDDATVSDKAWRKFSASAVSLPYRVNRRN